MNIGGRLCWKSCNAVYGNLWSAAWRWPARLKTLLLQRGRTMVHDLSVVSFNSTKRRVESFIVSYVGYTNCMLLNVLFCCLWHNIEASCHKHFVVFFGNQRRRLLPVMCHNLRDGGRCPPATAFTTPSLFSVNTGSQVRYRLRIAISAYPTCIRRHS